MTRKTANKYISRIDNDSTHGWLVRGYRNGITYSKLFSDGKYDSKQKCLLEAREYRDKLVKRIEKIPKKKRIKPKPIKRSKRDSTGVTGVTVTKKISKTGIIYNSYTASWRNKSGKTRSKTFAVNKHGEAKALKLATQCRRKAMIEIHGKSGKPKKVDPAKVIRKKRRSLKKSIKL